MDGTTVATAANLPGLEGSWAGSGVGDYNDDGKADLFLRNQQTEQTVLWVMNGTTVAEADTLPSLSPTWQSADFSNFIFG